MSKPDETQIEQLVRDVAEQARRLGFEWKGPGGAFLLETPGEQSRWQVYSEWGGEGVTAEVDCQNGELLRIQDAPVETVGTPLQMPDALLPDENEVIAFVRGKAAAIGWAWPDPGRALWTQDDQVWRVWSGGVSAEVEGKKGRLRLIKLDRR